MRPTKVNLFLGDPSSKHYSREMESVSIEEKQGNRQKKVKKRRKDEE